MTPKSTPKRLAPKIASDFRGSFFPKGSWFEEEYETLQLQGFLGGAGFVHPQ